MIEKRQFEEEELVDLQASVAGVTSGPITTVSAIEREIRDLLDRVAELSRKLADGGGSGRLLTSMELRQRLRTLYPFMYVAPYGDNYVEMEAGIDNGSVAYYSDSGKHYYTSGPAHTHALVISKNSTVRFKKDTRRSLYDPKYARGLPPGLAAELNEFKDVLRLRGVEYGHLHVHGSDLASNGIVNGTVCLGNNDGMLNLARRACSQSDFVMLIGRLYAWLTEYNLDSIYHSHPVPIEFTYNTEYSICADMLRLCGVAKSILQMQEYKELIDRIDSRGGADGYITVNDWATVTLPILAAARDELLPEFETLREVAAKTLLERLFAFVLADTAQGALTCAEKMVCLHQALSIILLLGVDNHGHAALRREALCDLLTLRHTWYAEMAVAPRRLCPTGLGRVQLGYAEGNTNAYVLKGTSWGVLSKYFGNYDYLTKGN